MKNKMVIEILDNGTIKVETGDMSGTSHYSAGEFLRDMERETGAKVKKKKLKKTHSHTHVHLHEKE